jgi:hypothetical protein
MGEPHVAKPALMMQPLRHQRNAATPSTPLGSDPIKSLQRSHSGFRVVDDWLRIALSESYASFR